MVINHDIYISDIIYKITCIGSDSFAVVLVFKFVRCLKRRLTLSYIMSEPSFTLTLYKYVFHWCYFQQIYKNIDKIIIAFKDISLFHYSYIRPFNKRPSWYVWTFTVGNIGVIGIIFQQFCKWTTYLVALVIIHQLFYSNMIWIVRVELNFHRS